METPVGKIETTSKHGYPMMVLMYEMLCGTVAAQEIVYSNSRYTAASYCAVKKHEREALIQQVLKNFSS
jgi:hypothetical protein